MQQTTMSINAVIMSFMIGCVLLGFLAIGVVAAAPIELEPGQTTNKENRITCKWSIDQRCDQQKISFDDKFESKGATY